MTRPPEASACITALRSKASSDASTTACYDQSTSPAARCSRASGSVIGTQPRRARRRPRPMPDRACERAWAVGTSRSSRGAWRYCRRRGPPVFLPRGRATGRRGSTWRLLSAGATAHCSRRHAPSPSQAGHGAAPPTKRSHLAAIHACLGPKFVQETLDERWARVWRFAPPCTWRRLARSQIRTPVLRAGLTGPGRVPFDHQDPVIGPGVAHVPAPCPAASTRVCDSSSDSRRDRVPGGMAAGARRPTPAAQRRPPRRQ